MDVSAYHRGSNWSAIHAVVAGIGVAGFACADQLAHLGARVTVVDGAGSQEAQIFMNNPLRRDGYVVLAKNASDTDTAHTPTWLRLPGGRAARSYPLGAWEHDTPRRNGCTHLLATMAGYRS